MTKPQLPRLAALLITVLAAAPAFSQGFSAHFDDGLDGWTALGDVGLVAARGGQAAALTTASASFEDDFGLAAGALNLSGGEPAATGLDLEAFVGLAPGALDLDAATMASEGSALRRSFAVAAGDRLSFDWQLATRDTDIGLDYAFVVIGGQRFDLGQAQSATQPGSGLYLGQTGLMHFEHTFALGGEVTVAFGVVDVLDYGASSALYLDNVAIAAVPEPGSYALMLGGIAALAALRRSRRGA